MHNVAVLEKGWIGGGNTGRNTTIVRSNYLWTEASLLYEKSHAALGGAEPGPELQRHVQPARRLQPRPYAAGHARHRAAGQREPAERHRCRSRQRRSRSRKQFRSSTPHPARATRYSAHRCNVAPALRATMRSRGASRAPPMLAVWTSSSSARLPGIIRDGGRVTGVETTRGTDRCAESRRRRGRPRERARRRWPACDCRSRAIRCRRSSPSR